MKFISLLQAFSKSLEEYILFIHPYINILNKMAGSIAGFLPNVEYVLYKSVKSNPSVTSNSNLTESSSLGIKGTCNANPICCIGITFFVKFFILLLCAKKEVQIRTSFSLSANIKFFLIQPLIYNYS